jgi:hypothetical protein
MLRPRFRRFGGIAEVTLIPLAGKHNWEATGSTVLPIAGSGDAAVTFPAVSAWWPRPRKSDEISCPARRESEGASELKHDME